jgi:hypothetical protein
MPDVVSVRRLIEKGVAGPLVPFPKSWLLLNVRAAEEKRFVHFHCGEPFGGGDGPISYRIA